MPTRDLRVSYAKRDRVSALLNRHHLEGRLDGTELAERLAAVSTAVTRADLNSVVQDLPGALDTVPRRDVLELTNTAGDLRRAGEWLVPPRVIVRSWFGKRDPHAGDDTCPCGRECLGLPGEPPADDIEIALKDPWFAVAPATRNAQSLNLLNILTELMFSPGSAR